MNKLLIKSYVCNLVKLCYVVILLHFRVCQADDSLEGIRLCCLSDSLNYTLTDGELYCLGGSNGVHKFNIDCHGIPVEVIDFDDLHEIRALEEEYCYVNHTTSEVSNETVYIAAVCEQQYHTPISVHLMPISFVFLVITFVIYYKIKTLRAPEDIAFIITVICLAVFIFVHVPHYWLSEVEELHGFFSFLDLYIAQFAIVAYFSWLNVVMANQLRKNMYAKISSDMSLMKLMLC